MNEPKPQENRENIKFPDYREIINEIKIGLSERAQLITKRTFFAFWLGLLVFMPLFLLWVIVKFELVSLSKIIEDIRFFYVLAVFFFFAGVYSFFTSHLLSVEKILWIDSYFDRKKLSPDESLKIAKKMFIPTLKFRLLLFFRYYLLSTVIFLILLSGLVAYLHFDFPLKGGFYFIIGFAIGSAILGFYVFYYLKLRLRYAWFLFFDNYTNKNFSISQLFKEMENLNEVNKNETFKKLLAIHLGSDFVTDMTKSTAGFLVSKIIGRTTKTREAASDLLSGYVSGLLTEMGNYGKNIANYIFYRYARFYLYNESQKINENIYSLAKN